MKVQSIIIGKHQQSPATSFCLYQFPAPLPSPPHPSTNEISEYERRLSYFCLDDLFALFDLQSAHHDFVNTFKFYPNFFFKDQVGRIYIQTAILTDISLRNTNYTLADLCRLPEKELFDGGAVPLLKMTTDLLLFSSPGIAPVELIPRRLEGTEWIFQKIKNEPSSPDNSYLLTPSLSTSPQSARLSSDILSGNDSSLPFEQSLTMNKSEVVIKLPEPKPSSLLLKRLAPGHSHKNLTIFTPSYSDESAAVIHSAPLRTLNSNHRDKPSKVVKKSKSGHFQTKLNVPNKPMATPVTATGAPKSSVQTRFPSPPIVPSQKPAWGQHRQHLRAGIKTATTPNFPRTPITTSTPVSKQILTQKQKFLQPFEYLYDHIEQTRQLKTTLDDQVRHSSSLLQNFQASSTMVESMVHTQVHEMVEQRFEARLKECIERIESLEYRSPGVETPTKPKNSSTPKESVRDVLTQLMNRLERIESKLDKSKTGA